MATATTHELEPRTVACQKCGGTGIVPGDHLCSRCNGTGTVRLDLDIDWLRGRVAELEAENERLRADDHTPPGLSLERGQPPA